MPINQWVTTTKGMTPADIEAMVQTAKRFAFGRSNRDDQLPPLITQDILRAIERVNPVRYPEPAQRAALA